MIIHVDAQSDPPAVTLRDPEDCRRFHVEAPDGETARLAQALEQQQVGRMLPSGDALIDIAAVRRMAEGRVSDTWERDFSAMLDYARTKGWLNDAGTAIQAHVETAAEPG